MRLAGAVVPLYVILLGGTNVILGAYNAIHRLFTLTTGRTRGPQARRATWQGFRWSLLPIVAGIWVLLGGWANETGRWLVAIAAGTIVVWDRGLWLRSCIRGRSGRDASEPG